MHAVIPTLLSILALVWAENVPALVPDVVRRDPEAMVTAPPELSELAKRQLGKDFIGFIPWSGNCKPARFMNSTREMDD